MISNIWTKIFNLKNRYIKTRLIPPYISIIIDTLIYEPKDQFIFKKIFKAIRLFKYRITKKRDWNAVENIDYIVTNSEYTKSRINKIYNRDSSVVYPPVDDSFFSDSDILGDYWISINRLVRHKRIEIQLEAFEKIPSEKLIIVGGFDLDSSQYVKTLYSKLPTNVSHEGFLDDEELQNILKHSKGFITTAKNEDFGMSAVEAMAAGKPVIAPNEGGYKESVINNETGILIDNLDSDKLKDAILKISDELKESPDKYRSACIERAKEFSTENFVRGIEKEIQKIREYPNSF